MKILVIMGSPRKGNTYRACEEFREILQQDCGAEFEYLWLKDVNLQPCRGCLTCFGYGEEKCPNRDDAPAIEQKMREADGVVFASPVYGMNVTGQMKTFIDRFSYIFHRPRFFDKKACVLATTGFIGHNEVTRYLSKVAGIWGFEVAGTAGLITVPIMSHKSAGQNKKILTRAANNFSAALLRKKRKIPGIMEVVIFHAQKAVFSQLEKESPCDYQYWKQQGWLEPGVKYFTDVQVNPLFQAIGIIVERIQMRQVKKGLERMTQDSG